MHVNSTKKIFFDCHLCEAASYYETNLRREEGLEKGLSGNVEVVRQKRGQGMK